MAHNSPDLTGEVDVITNAEVIFALIVKIQSICFIIELFIGCSNIYRDTSPLFLCIGSYDGLCILSIVLFYDV